VLARTRAILPAMKRLIMLVALVALVAAAVKKLQSA
jgi:hypothetical protein